MDRRNSGFLSRTEQPPQGRTEPEALRQRLLFALLAVALPLQWIANDGLRKALTAAAVFAGLVLSWRLLFPRKGSNYIHPAERLMSSFYNKIDNIPHEQARRRLSYSTHFMESRFAESEKECMQLLSEVERDAPDDYGLMYSIAFDMCELVVTRDGWAAAVPWLQKTYDLALRSVGHNHPVLVDILAQMALALVACSRYEEAIRAAREGLRVVQTLDGIAGTRSLATSSVEDSVSLALFENGDFEEGLLLLRASEAGHQSIVGEEPTPVILRLRALQATFLGFQGRREEFGALLASREEMPADHPYRAWLDTMYDFAAYGLGDYELFRTKEVEPLLLDMSMGGAIADYLDAPVGARIGHFTNPARNMAQGLVCNEAAGLVHVGRFRSAMEVLDLVTPVLREGGEQTIVPLQLANLVLGVISCWQSKHMEAEQLAEEVASSLCVYFGSSSPEYSLALVFRGYVAACRGKFSQALLDFGSAHNYMADLVPADMPGFTNLSSFSSLPTAVRVYTALAHVCLGNTSEAKVILVDICSEFGQGDPEQDMAMLPHACQRLVWRCLGTMAALDGNWPRAETLFRRGLEETPDENTESDIIGSLMGRWNLAWATFEQGNTETALELLRSVADQVKCRFGLEHKFSIGCRHDILWMSKGENTDVEGSFEQLLETATDVLGLKHHLTKKIRISSRLCASRESDLENKTNGPRRIWALGESAARPIRLFDVDWLTWSWQLNEAGDMEAPMMITQAVSETRPQARQAFRGTKTTSEKTPELAAETAATEHPRKMGVTGMHCALSLLGKLLKDFPRDFGPAFIESAHASSREVPYVELRQLNPHDSQSTQRAPVTVVRHLATDQLYARKTLRWTRATETRARVLAEVSALRKLSHPHIVRLCCAYIVESEAIYALLMQPVADMDLAMYLEVCVAGDDEINAVNRARMPPWFACLLGALHYLHGRNIKHRDIKPGNILVRGDEVYVTDLGSARDWSGEATSATRGYRVGVTPRYSAPEAQDWDEEETDPRRTRATDVFSLGCVFAEMCSVLGGRSVQRFTAERVLGCDEDHYCRCPVEVMDELLEGVQAYGDFVRDMMAHDPGDRPSTQALMARLESGISGGYGPLVCCHRPETTDKA